MPVDETRINWNVLFRAIRSYSVIVHQELIDDLFLHERKLQFLHVKQQHPGRFPPGRVGVPLATRIPYATNSIQFCSIVHIKKIHGEKTNHQRRKSTISF